MAYAPPKRKLTADEYQRMGEAGIFHPEERVELLDGELYELTHPSDYHAGTVIAFSQFFGLCVGNKALVSVHNPIRLSPYSEPEPDITLLRPRDDFYRSGKARPEAVLLLIEVADTSLDHDRLTKLPRYAAAGIVEVWIVNLIDEQVEVYRDPAGDIYKTRTIHVRGDTVTPAALPDVTIHVDEILG